MNKLKNKRYDMHTHRGHHENGSVCIASINEPIKDMLKTENCELTVNG